MFGTLVALFCMGMILMATVGKGFGGRKLYIKILLAIFESSKEKREHNEPMHSQKPKVPPKLELETVEEELDEITDIVNHKNKQCDRLRIRRMSRSPSQIERFGFRLEDAMDFCRDGFESIIEDEVTQRFDAAELSSWNLLTRTNTSPQFISLRLTIIYCIGWILRYVIFLPCRIFLCAFAVSFMMIITAVIGNLPASRRIKKWLIYRATLTWSRIFCRSFSAVITFHNEENRPKGGGICVANHTSPLDIVILTCDNAYALIGQAHGGFVGAIQRSFSRSTPHIWFQRSEVKDRSAVTERLREHIDDPDKEPILIFPEGTCVNNTSIMMFKKGSFEVGGVIYPIAIKYDPIFADPFWNSSEQSFSKHMLLIMTSWALVVDIWYLPPMIREPDEDAVEFANRVKAEIARQGGLVDLDWDGALKRSRPKDNMKESVQAEYSAKLKEL